MALTVRSRHARPGNGRNHGADVGENGAGPPAANASPASPASASGTARPGKGGTGSHAGPAGKALYRVPEAMRLLSLSRSVIYHQIRVGRLRSVKEGSTRLIPADAIADYVALLEAEAEASR